MIRLLVSADSPSPLPFLVVMGWRVVRVGDDIPAAVGATDCRRGAGQPVTL